MAVNRFSNILQGPQFKARSLQETLIAPMALRESHDATVNALETNLATAMQAEVGEEYGEQFGEYLKQYETGTEALINDINTSGINNNAVLDKFGSMKRKMDKDFSNQGVVGKLVNTNSRVKAANDNSIKLAISQGQSPERASEIAKEDRAAYYAGLPQDFKDIKGEFADYNPRLAPKYTDVIKEFTPIYNLMGSVSDTLSTKGIRTDNYQIEPDANGVPQLIGYDKIENTRKRVDMTNDPNLANAISVLWGIQQNKNSPLMQNLRYLGHDVENLMDTMRGLQGVASKTVSVDERLDNTTFVPIGGGRAGGTSKAAKEGKEEEPNTADIILEMPTAGMDVKSNVDSMNRLNEINALHPSAITPTIARERNDLMLKKSLIDKEVENLTESKYLVNGKLNEEFVTPEQRKEFENNTNVLFNKDAVTSAFDKMIEKYDEFAKTSGTGSNREGLVKRVNQIKDMIFNPHNEFSDKDILSLIESRVKSITNTRGTSLSEFGPASTFYTEMMEELKPLVANTKKTDKDIAKVLAEREVRELSTASTLQTYNVSALNSASAMKDPTIARAFADPLLSLALNASGGGKLTVVNPEGKTDPNVDLSDKKGRESITEIMNNASNVSIVAFDVGVGENFVRFNVTNKDSETNQVILPLRTDEKNGKVPELLDAVFKRLMSYGTARDAQRINTIRDEFASAVPKQPLPIDNGLTQGDNTNYNRVYPDIASSTKEAARNYNLNGIMYKGQRAVVDISELDSNHYPYTRTDLETIGNFVVNKGNQGNFYTTKYKVKNSPEGQYEYYNYNDYIQTTINKGLSLEKNINEPTKQASINGIMDNTFALIAAGKLTGVSALDTHELSKIQMERDAAVKAITDRLGADVNIGNLEAVKAQINKELFSLNESFNARLKNIPIAASHKKYLL